MKINNRLIIMPAEDVETLIMSAIMTCLEGINKKHTFRQQEVGRLTVTELAKYRKCSKAIIYREVKKGEIPHYKQSNKLYFEKAEINAWLSGHK